MTRTTLATILTLLTSITLAQTFTPTDVMHHYANHADAIIITCPTYISNNFTHVACAELNGSSRLTRVTAESFVSYYTNVTWTDPWTESHAGDTAWYHRFLIVNDLYPFAITTFEVRSYESIVFISALWEEWE